MGPLLAAVPPDAAGCGLAAAISCGVKFILYSEFITPATVATDVLKNKAYTITPVIPPRIRSTIKALFPTHMPVKVNFR
jgi:hypothetical protein